MHCRSHCRVCNDREIDLVDVASIRISTKAASQLHTNLTANYGTVPMKCKAFANDC